MERVIQLLICSKLQINHASTNFGCAHAGRPKPKDACAREKTQMIRLLSLGQRWERAQQDQAHLQIQLQKMLEVLLSNVRQTLV